jgi:hypothetical protein
MACATALKGACPDDGAQPIVAVGSNSLTLNWTAVPGVDVPGAAPEGYGGCDFGKAVIAESRA